MANALLTYVAAMISASSRKVRLPPSQKHAVVTALSKRLRLDTDELKNYRDVSNLSGRICTTRRISQPGIERVQALADISRSRCCRSNETRSPIANPLNSAQLGGIPYHSPELHLGPRSIVGMWRRASVSVCLCVSVRRHCGDEQTQTDRQTQTHARDQYTFCIISSTTHAKCKANGMVPGCDRQ